MIGKRKALKLFAGLVLISVLIFAFLLVVPQMEKVTGLETINSEGKSGKILVVYHPGLSSFQKDVTMSFVRGLVERGYIVDITTPSSKTTTEINEYEIIVLGAPTYEFAPAKPMENYIKRVGDFKGKKIVAILTGSGSTDESVAKMKELIEIANGIVIESLPLWSSAPNEEVYGISDPSQIAYKYALNLKIS
jgi:flavorubredoxin